MRAVLVLWLAVLAARLARGSGDIDAAAALNFTVMGDWGGQETSPYYTQAEKNIAEQMGKRASAIGSQFTVALGDNFYSHGVTDVDDARFKETFEVWWSIRFANFYSKPARLSNHAECLHSQLLAVSMVRDMWQSRSLWQRIGRGGLHCPLQEVVHARLLLY